MTKMVKRIDRLTPEQEAQIEPWAQRWIEKGLKTDRADWAGFERGARECYRLSGLEQPKIVVRCASPLIAAVTGYVVDELGRAGLDRVLERAPGRSTLFDPETTYQTLQDAVVATVSGLLPGKLNKRTAREVILEEGRKIDLRKAKYSYFGGQFWLSWQAFESFFHDVCHLDSGKRAEAEAYRLAQESACWWLPYDWGITVSDRPTVIGLEQIAPRGWGSHRLHREEGPALHWTDGFAIYAWHGVVVAPHVIERPESITLEEINGESNAEVRRVLRERYGEGRYLVESKAKLLDADFEGARKGAAPRALVEDKDGQRWLIGTDGSTSRTYYMPVPPGVKTCREAHEALCGFPEASIINKS